MKNKDAAVLRQVAEVQLGKYEARITEDDLRFLADIRDESGEDDMPSYIDEIMDYMITCANEGAPDDLGEVMANLGVLQRVKKAYRRISEMNITLKP